MKEEVFLDWLAKVELLLFCPENDAACLLSLFQSDVDGEGEEDIDAEIEIETEGLLEADTEEEGERERLELELGEILAETLELGDCEDEGDEDVGCTYLKITIPEPPAPPPAPPVPPAPPAPITTAALPENPDDVPVLYPPAPPPPPVAVPLPPPPPPVLAAPAAALREPKGLSAP